MSRERFIELIGDAVVALPQDLKSILRIVEDPEIDDESRTELAATILHVLSSNNAIPGVRGILQHVGDVLVLRLALERIEKRSAEPFAQHREDSPDLLDPMNEQLEVARAYLGDGIQVLDAVIDSSKTIQFKGHTAKECVTEDEGRDWLYDSVHEAIIDLDFDDDDVSRELKQVDKILQPLASRVRK